MPRTARASVGDICYHVINRANGRVRIFHDTADYDAFERLVKEGCERLPMRVVAHCVMPNHFHLLLWPHGDGDLGGWMQWLLTTHVRRYHRRYGTEGRLWQGRYKAFPIQEDNHLITVIRYIERNPLRANLVTRAEYWAWSSLARRHSSSDEGPHDPPVPLLADWVDYVNTAQSLAELELVRQSVNRERPFGDGHWQASVARRLGLEHTLRPRGRPPGDGKRGHSPFSTPS